MSELDTNAFYALVPSLDPTHISSYLASEGWVLLERREESFEYWQEPSSSNDQDEPSPTLLLPLSRAIRNYERRLVEFLVELAEIYECGPEQLRGRLSARDWDTFSLRVLDRSEYDSIELAFALRILETSQKMIQLSALHTVNPHRSFRGPRGRSVNSYLKNHVRISHTERGSFVFPLLSSVQVPEAQDQLFGRRVMESLARGLYAVRHGSIESQLDISLRETIEKLTRTPGCSSFDISFKWSPARPAPRDISQHPIKFDIESLSLGHDYTMSSTQDEDDVPTGLDIPVAIRHASRSPDRSEVVEIEGQIVALSVDDRGAGGSQNPFIIIRTSHGKEIFDVLLPLDSEGLQFALEYYKNGTPVTASGTLSRVAGQRILEGVLTIPYGPDVAIRARQDKKSR